MGTHDGIPIDILATNATPPTIVVNVNAGTGGAAALEAGSTDQRGRINLTIQVSPIPDNSIGTQCTIFFGTRFASGLGPIVLFSQRFGGLATSSDDIQPYQFSDDTSLVIGANKLLTVAGTYSFVFDYQVIGTLG